MQNETKPGVAVIAYLGSRLVFALLLGVLGVTGCGRYSTDGEEIARVSSPDNRVDAVLIEVATGATVATPTELYITAKGAKPVVNDLVLRADHVSEVTLRWEAEKLLEFGYRSARIYRFSNFWRSRNVDNSEYQVEIKLGPKAPRSVE